MTKSNSDLIKVLELISNQIFPDDEEEVFDIMISEEDIEKIGLSYNSIFLILKQLHNSNKLYLDPPTQDQYEDQEFTEPGPVIKFSLNAPYFIDDYLYELKYKKPNKDTLKFKINNEYIFNFNVLTGEFTYNSTNNIFSPNNQEFKILKSLIISKNFQKDYKSLIKLIYHSEKVLKSNKEDLSRVIRNIKRKLKILPRNENSNPDFFKNLKNYGYKLNMEKLED